MIVVRNHLSKGLKDQTYFKMVLNFGRACHNVIMMKISLFFYLLNSLIHWILSLNPQIIFN